MLTPQQLSPRSQNDKMAVGSVPVTESVTRPGKYGPGHEKHPSWPMPASEDVPLCQRGPQSGTSYRSKSWTDQTNYTKEPGAGYTKPFMLKKQPRSLKTVMEKSERLQTEPFFQHHHRNSAASLLLSAAAAAVPSSTAPKPTNKYKLGSKTRSIEDYLYADLDLHKPSPQKLPAMIAVSDQSPQHYNCPYQDVMVVTKKPKPKPQHLTQADLDAYTKSYEQQKPQQSQRKPDSGHNSDKSYFVHSKQHSIGSYSSSSGSSSGASSGTAATGPVLLLPQHLNHHHHQHHHHHHQKQSSYAQSEGYHSYVSSITDSSSSSVSTSLSTPTPFLDRLRRDTDAVLATQTKLSKTSSFCDTEGRDSVVTNSSGSGSSNDTLKWHGSLSDVSTMSGSFGREPDLTDPYDSGDFVLQQHAKHTRSSPDHLKHLIAHSSKVQAPQKHHSESVRFIESNSLRNDGSSSGGSGGSGGSSCCTSSSAEEDDNSDGDNLQTGRQRCFAFNRKSMRKVRTKNEVNGSAAAATAADDEAVRKLRLFPVSTYTVRPQPSSALQRSTDSYASARNSVAERVSDIESKQSAAAAGTQPTSDPISNFAGELPEPPPLPPPLKPKSIVPTPVLPRRSASYSLDLASSSSSYSRHDTDSSSSCAALIGPVICGPAISVDDWVPERPPKNPALLKQIYKEMNAMRVSKQQQPEHQHRNSCSSNSTSSNSQVSGAVTIVGQQSDTDDDAAVASSADNDTVAESADGTDQKRSPLTMAATASSGFGSQTNPNRVQYKTSTKKSLLTSSASLTSSSSSSSSSSLSAHYATLSSSHLANGVYKRTISPQNRRSPPPPAPTRPNRHPYSSAPAATSAPATSSITTSPTDRKNFPKTSSALISSKTPPAEGAAVSSAGATGAPINLPDLLPIRKLGTPSTSATSITATTASSTSTTIATDDCSGSDEPTTGTISSTSGCDTSLGSSSSSSSSTSSSFKSRSNSLQNSPILTSNRQSRNDVASQTDSSLVECEKKAAVLLAPVSRRPFQPHQPKQSLLKFGACYNDKLPSRKKSPEEVDCEMLSLDLINHLSSTDRLKCILTPVPESKKISDYISGLYRTDIISQPLKSSLAFQTKPAAPGAASSGSVAAATAACATSSEPSSNKSSSASSENQSASSASSASFSVAPTSNPVFLAASESKAKILSKLNYNFNEYKITQDTKYLQKKKMELISRLNRKLDVLRVERKSLEQQCARNDSLGANIANHLAQFATSRELTKYQMYIEEIDKITNLLLSLTLRLVRTENVILISECANEKKTLEEKRSKLHDQLREAKILKESIQRKSSQVTKMLNKYLSTDELCDFNHYVNWKAKLITETREINDRIESSENQLQALKMSLNSNI